MTTKPMPMSADIGFEALTESRRRSLMNIVERLDRRFESSAVILEAMVDDKSFTATHVKAATRIRDLYKKIRSDALLQFPEIRADRRGQFSPDDAMTNPELNSEVASVDRQFAAASGIGVSDLREWLEYGGTVPKLSPLFARHWGEKAEAKAAREAREKEAREAKEARK